MSGIHRVYPTRGQPLRYAVQIFSETPEFPHRFIVPIRRYCYKMAFRAYIDTDSVGVCQSQTTLAFLHDFLHHVITIPRRYGYVTLIILSNGMCSYAALTNVADVTQDHANKRAGSHHWRLGLAGAVL